MKRIPHFALLIKKHGIPDLKRGNDPFQALCRSIIYQQVSGKAAATVFARFVALFPMSAPSAHTGEYFPSSARFPTPTEVAAMPIEKLRSVGLSGQKAAYIKDLAEKFAGGVVKHDVLHTMKNEEIIEHLTQIKGVGVWTVQMFLIFTLNRLDVLPTGDLGIQKGFQIVYKLRKLPSAAHMERLAKPWREHASVASWYLWRAADGAKAQRK